MNEWLQSNLEMLGCTRFVIYHQSSAAPLPSVLTFLAGATPGIVALFLWWIERLRDKKGKRNANLKKKIQLINIINYNSKRIGIRCDDFRRQLNLAIDRAKVHDQHDSNSLLQGFRSAVERYRIDIPEVLEISNTHLEALDDNQIVLLEDFVAALKQVRFEQFDLANLLTSKPTPDELMLRAEALVDELTTALEKLSRLKNVEDVPC